MQQFELDYAALIRNILENGAWKEGRNGRTMSIFGEQLKIDMRDHSKFPLLQGRKMFPKGVIGEFAAMIRKPQHLKDFERFGCNYWKQWADEDGFLTVDYGNAWFKGGQIDHLKDCLANNPNDRRMIINAWRPERLDILSLPCCHYAYQFYVAGGYLSMVWIQRSVDTMIGLPSDIILAAIWLITLANEFGYKTGDITMQLGDCHLYEEHIQSGAVDEYIAKVYDLQHVLNKSKNSIPHYILNSKPGKDFLEFIPEDLLLTDYYSGPKIKLELKS